MAAIAQLPHIFGNRYQRLIKSAEISSKKSIKINNTYQKSKEMRARHPMSSIEDGSGDAGRGRSFAREAEVAGERAAVGDGEVVKVKYKLLAPVMRVVVSLRRRRWWRAQLPRKYR